MIFHGTFTQSKLESIVFEFDIKLNSNHDSFVVLEELQNMWSNMCHVRDTRLAKLRFKVSGYTIKDQDALAGVISSLNTELLFTYLLEMLELNVPNEAGREWIRTVFRMGSFCDDQVLMCGLRGEKLRSIYPLQIGTFDVTFVKHDENYLPMQPTIEHCINANHNYNYNDYRNLCKYIYDNTAEGNIPFVTINPLLLTQITSKGFGKLNVQLAYELLSSHIICAALTRRGNVQNRAAKDLWVLGKMITTGRASEEDAIAVIANASALIEQRILSK